MTERKSTRSAAPAADAIPGFTIDGARSPEWIDAEHTAITLLVTFSDLGEVRFTASPEDPEPYGRELFAAARAGQYGKVQAPSPVYVNARVEAQLELLLHDATQQIGQLSAHLATLEDAQARRQLSETARKRRTKFQQQLNAWRDYRSLLGLVPDQTGFPQQVIWPPVPLED